MFTEVISPRFSEMNPAAHIGFTVLPTWFEKAAEEVYRIFMPELDPKAWSLIVAKFELECLAEIHHGREVVIQTSIARIGTASFVLSQVLLQGDQPAARAETTMVHFDYQVRKSLPLNDALRKALSLHMTKG